MISGPLLWLGFALVAVFAVSSITVSVLIGFKLLRAIRAELAAMNHKGN